MSPDAAAAPDLVFGFYSLAETPLAARIEAAAAAGFTATSLYWPEILAARREGSLAALAKRFRDSGLAVPQMEIIPLPTRGELVAFKAQARLIAGVSAELGCEVVHAAALTRTAGDDETAEGFAVLAAACAGAGLGCGIEFVPYLTAVKDLATAARMVTDCGVAGAGIVLDALHFFRSGAPWELLAALPAEQITSVQINDGPQPAVLDSYATECMTMRLLPGDGGLDLLRFLSVIEAAGVRLPLTVEVPNRELWQLGPAAAATRMKSATLALQQRHAARETV
jgi:sugar phosphate isomerase/epimerase